MHRQDFSFLHFACQEGLVQSAGFIIDKHPSELLRVTKANWSPLMTACEAAQTEVIKSILQKAPFKSEVDNRTISKEELIFFKTLNGSPMHAALGGDNPSGVFTILEKLLDAESTRKLANLKDLKGVSVLFLATYIGDIKMVNLLLAKGGKVESASNSRTTLLHVCAERNFFELSKIII